jgi:hypothetical protein
MGTRFARLGVGTAAFAYPPRLTTDGLYFRQASRIAAMLSLVKREMPRKQTARRFTWVIVFFGRITFNLVAWRRCTRHATTHHLEHQSRVQLSSDHRWPSRFGAAVADIQLRTPSTITMMLAPKPLLTVQRYQSDQTMGLVNARTRSLPYASSKRLEDGKSRIIRIRS